MLVTGENISTRRKTSTRVTFHKNNQPDGEIFIDALQVANTRGREVDETRVKYVSRHFKTFVHSNC